MPLLVHIFSTLSADDVQRIQSILDQLSTTAPICITNITRDHHLIPAAITQIATRMHPAPTDLATLFCEHFSNYVLQGPPATITNGLLGKIESLESAAERLSRHHLRGIDPLDAKSILREIAQTGGSGYTQQDSYKTFPLGKYLMWATFNESNQQDDPFAPFNNSADEIADLLALQPPDDAAGPITEFVGYVYQLPNQVRTLVPTVFDAYAGGFQDQFVPAVNPTDWHGRTAPPSRKTGLPEVVHDVQSFDVCFFQSPPVRIFTM